MGLGGKYLGIQINFQEQKKEIFQGLIRKFREKYGSWKAKLLNLPGRITLAKHVLSSLAIYPLGIFRIPKGILKKIDQMNASFIWGGELEGRTIHWKSWKQICRPKQVGGLGMRSALGMNKAHLAKHIRNLLKESKSLFTQVYTTKYIKDRDLKTLVPKPGDSWGWRSILWAW